MRTLFGAVSLATDGMPDDISLPTQDQVSKRYIPCLWLRLGLGYIL